MLLLSCFFWWFWAGQNTEVQPVPFVIWGSQLREGAAHLEARGEDHPLLDLPGRRCIRCPNLHLPDGDRQNMAKSYGSRLRVENLWIILDLSPVFMRKNRFLARVQHGTSPMTPLWVTTADLWMDSGHTLGPLGRRSTISGQYIYNYIYIIIYIIIIIYIYVLYIYINIISYFFVLKGGSNMFKHMFKHMFEHVYPCLSHSLSSSIWPASLWNCGEHHLMWWMGTYDISNSMNIDES